MEATTLVVAVNQSYYAVSLSLQLGYQGTSAFFGFLDLYLFSALVTYELFMPNKPPSGKILRLMCLLASFTAILHQCLQQLIVIYAGTSQPACTSLMMTKSAIFNAIVSFTYAFFWLRQRSFYANPQLHNLRGKWMESVTWIVLGLLVINPCIMLGFQFNGELFRVVDDTCLILNLEWYRVMPFVAVAFSYSVIQVALIFLYFYPLYKRNIPKKPPIVMMSKHFTGKSVTVDNYLDGNSAVAKSGSRSPKSNHLKVNTQSCDDALSSRNSALHSPSSPRLLRKSKTHSLKSRMRRWLILSSICVITDIISASIIASFLIEVTPASLITVMFLWHDASMFINVACLIGCFRNYRVMLFPFGSLLRRKG